MRSFLRKKLAGLTGCTSGNAAVIVALGMPMLIGGAGLGVDVAQWYMWKRELQFAVDQAAMAGAWARTRDATKDTFQARAAQEFDANTAMIEDFAVLDEDDIALADYDGGTNNSVVVAAKVSKELPFTSFLTGTGVEIAASAQAVWTGGVNFHACMLALNESESAAFKLGGNVKGSSSCGAGTLSDHPTSAMFEASDTNVQLGTLVAAGDIDNTYVNNGTLYENQEGLTNPYNEIEPPSSAGQPTRTYPATCPVASAETTTYKASGTTQTHYTFTYHKKANSNNLNNSNKVANYNGTGYVGPSWSAAIPFVDKSVTTAATGEQAETVPAAGTPVYLSGSGNQTYWRVPYTSTKDTITSVTSYTVPGTDGEVTLLPGVYASLEIGCDTVFSPGVYFVNGAFDFGNGETVTGTGGVMFVLTSSAGDLTVNAQSDVTLSGIELTTLTGTYGYTEAEAAQLAGMLIWDPDSESKLTFNGGASLHLSGILYMPGRDAKFNGNAAQGGDAAGNCLMVAADTIDILGSFSLSNFCTSTGGSAMSIGGTNTGVRLVA